MMASTRRCMEAFRAVVGRAGLNKDAKIAVALSGGSDSLALLWLSRSVFDKVVAITVDHKLRPQSAEDARKAGELARNLDVDHRVLTVNWEGPPPSRSAVQNPARNHRYKLLLDMCREHSITTLMMGHHVDDQIETMLLRIRMGTGLEGLMGMRVFARRVSYPEITIIRPLLTCSKEDLLGLCRDRGLLWVEDLSNHSPWCVRNRVRELLSKREDMSSAALQLHTDLHATGDIVRRKVGQLLAELPILNEKYGYVILDRRRLLEQPRYIVWRLLKILGAVLSGEARSTHHQLLNNIWTSIMYKDRTAFFHKTLLIPSRNPKEDLEEIIVCKAPLAKRHRKRTRITLNEPLLWENSWEITLTSPQTSHAPTSCVPGRQYYVRMFEQSDICLARCGDELTFSSKLPHCSVCATLPVVVDEGGEVLAIPHFKYVKPPSTLHGSVSFKPPVSLSLHTLVNQYQN